ncbi:hypothetical protein [Streptomyces sp. NPDC048295]
MACGVGAVLAHVYPAVGEPLGVALGILTALGTVAALITSMCCR